MALTVRLSSSSRWVDSIEKYGILVVRSWNPPDFGLCLHLTGSHTVGEGPCHVRDLSSLYRC